MADALVGLATIERSMANDLLSAEGFDALVRMNQRRIFRVLMVLLRDEDAADTLTQECFLRAYKKRDSFRGESSVETWLVHIAVNLARDHQRSRRQAFWKKLFERGRDDKEDALPMVETVADHRTGAEERLIAREQLEKVWTTVDQLSPQQREVFVLRFVEEMSLEEIARALEVQLGTVKSHLSRALTTVRASLKEQ